MTRTVFAPTAAAARALVAEWLDIPLAAVGTPVRASGTVMGQPVMGTWTVDVPLPSRAADVPPASGSRGERSGTREPGRQSAA